MMTNKLDPDNVIAEAENYLGIRCVPEDQEPEESALISNLYTVAKSLLNPWQPIETMPDEVKKSQTDILVYSKVSNEQFVVYWRKGAWVLFANSKTTIEVADITHWMHKPKEPR